MAKMKTFLDWISAKIDKFFPIIAQLDALPDSTMIPVADVPAFGAAGRKPANAARAAVNIARRLSEEATKFSRYAARAADYAAAESASAEAALADADGAK